MQGRALGQALKVPIQNECRFSTRLCLRGQFPHVEFQTWVLLLQMLHQFEKMLIEMSNWTLRLSPLISSLKTNQWIIFKCVAVYLSLDLIGPAPILRSHFSNVRDAWSWLWPHSRRALHKYGNHMSKYSVVCRNICSKRTRCACTWL